jgi:nucleoside-diphosphate-sugar epimerase
MSEGIVLVTGASGFVGRHLVRRLRAEGRRVRGFCRSAPSGGAEEWIRADIRDAAAVAEAVRGAGTVFHVAGLIPGLGTDADLEAVNAEGSRNVAAACLAGGAGTMVALSSISVYRNTRARILREDDPVGGVDAYGRSKTRGEALIRETCGDRLRYALIRSCAVFGADDGTGYTDRMLRMLAWPVLPLVGGVARPYSLIHVNDLIDGLFAAEAGATVRGEAYNLAGPSQVTLPEMSHWARPGTRPTPTLPVPGMALRSALSLRWFLMHLGHPAKPTLWRSYAPGRTDGSLLLGSPEYDTGKARRELGYRPRVDFASALRDLVSSDAIRQGESRFSFDGRKVHP